MNVGIIGPSPVPYAFGGIEALLAGLQERISRDTPHRAELIKLPTREGSFWEIVESYRQFWSLDVSHFDRVISVKYPGWMVRHPHHICFMAHRLRGLYDAYPFGLPTQVQSESAPVRRLLEFMDAHAASSPDAVPGCFDLLDRLRAVQASVSSEIFAFPGPLVRRIVRFLDDHALAPDQIRRFCAISATVAARPDYFPPGAAVEVIHPPSRLSGFASTGRGYLFSTGRLDEPKRVDLLVKAMALAKAPGVLKVAGTGPAERALRMLAAEDGRVEFLGFVSDDALVDLYAGASAVLYVPREEDYGLVAIEAMKSRKPVITCLDSGGPLEFVEDGETGLVARPDPADIAQKIDALAADPERAAAMGRRGYERVRSITWERTVHALLGEPIGSRLARRPAASEASGRARLTVAVPYPVYPPLEDRQHRLFHLYREVARTFDVDLVSLAEVGSEPLEKEIEPGLREIRTPRSARHQEEEPGIASDAGVPIGGAVTPPQWQLSPAYLDQLSRSMNEADAIVACHPSWLSAIQKLRNGQLLVYDAQNVMPPECGASPREDAPRTAEADACVTASLIFCRSREDREAIVDRYGIDAGRVLVLPNGIDTDAIRFVGPGVRARRKAELGIADARLAVFVGNEHPPNPEAALALVPVARALPEVTFVLAGSVCTPLANHPWPANVGLMGVIDGDTLAALLSVADAALNPMLAPGMNIEMATYLAAGVPVVSTPLGARDHEAVDGDEALLAPIDTFPERLAQLWRDDALAERLATRGRRLVEERYAWKVIGARMTAAYRSLLACPRGGTKS